MGTRTLAVLLIMLALVPGLMVGYAVLARMAPAVFAAKSARARAVLDLVASTASTPPTLAATGDHLEPEKHASKTELERPAMILAVRVPGSAVLDIDGPALHAQRARIGVKSPVPRLSVLPRVCTPPRERLWEEDGMTPDDSILTTRLRVIRRAQELGSVTLACREAGISRTVFYRWRKRAKPACRT
jgi:hypothetical protein